MHSFNGTLEYIKDKTPYYIFREFQVYKYDDKTSLVHDTADNEIVFIKVTDGNGIFGHPYLKVFHREDGPAYIAEHFSRFFMNDKEYTFDTWLKKTPLSEQEKLKLRLQYAGT